MEDHKPKSKFGYAQKLWIKTCFFFVKLFYNRVEISGADKLSTDTPIILCANHSNALADAVLIQYLSQRLIHPLARSGLFKNPLIKPILSVWQAVPVFRRQDSGDQAVDNNAMFSKAYEMLSDNQILMIFPEGQSHSDLHLKQIKTGIARLALGLKEKYNITPLVIPVGLNFSQTRRFRSNVFIKLGDAVKIDDNYSIENEKHVKALTRSVMQSMRDQLLEVDELDELVFIKQIDRFYNLRKQTLRKRNLANKFKSHKYILSVKKRLNTVVPEKIKAFHRHLKQFNRLCHRLGINDYNLNVHYNSRVIRWFILKILFILLVVTQLAIFGFINSVVPYLLTKISVYLFARTKDQKDTVKILAGSLFFSFFWIMQINFVYQLYSVNIAVVYAILLLPCSLSALIIYHEQAQIVDNLRVFFVVLRRRNIRRYLIKKRKRIEKELSDLITIARQLNKKDHG